MNLYELAEQYQFLYDYDFDDEEEDLWLAQLEQLDDAIEQKAENIAKVLRELTAADEVYKEEINRLKQKRQAAKNRKERLRNYLFEMMTKTDKRKFKTELFSFNIQNGQPSLIVESEEHIPDEYFKIERKLNGQELKNDIKEGLVIDGVSLQRTESLVIR